ncbi:DNA-binding protein [uncultured Gammaproteobacteria bacterium]|jgi:Zn-dependent peptidase ImmA (M78 family)|nr:DNA-binding protein [uncultured Gammaproteobacteria bacterium]VVH67169.1 DNA-binding protein [uncultured Gammaproteobacteria bacterium]
MQIKINTQLIDWAIERSAKSVDDLMHKFPNLENWQNQTKSPTLKQLENFAKATFTPIGMLFLQEPPNEVLPINDFRTFTNNEQKKPSVNLLDVIYASQQRQEWYQNYVRQQDIGTVSIVGKYTTSDNPEVVAQEIVAYFDFHHNFKNWQTALSTRSTLIEEKGILVMSSGIVSGNTHRELDLTEFRGFALSDKYAPVIFINAKDTIAARNFTLMHELAHIAIAENGVSNTNAYNKNSNDTEKWCDKVAAEILVPRAQFKQKYSHNLSNLDKNLDQFARHFKVSTLVILGRIYSLGYFEEESFWVLFHAEKNRLLEIIAQQPKKKGGGDYYNSKPTSVSKLFMKTITGSALEGQTLYREAMRLLSVKKIKVFNNLTEQAHPWST